MNNIILAVTFACVATLARLADARSVRNSLGHNSFEFLNDGKLAVVTRHDSLEEHEAGSNDIVHALENMQKKENSFNHLGNSIEDSKPATAEHFPWDDLKKDEATKKESCVNKLPYDTCSIQFLIRGTCSPESGFDFFQNCQQYCEFCVPDLQGDGVIKTLKKDGTKVVTSKDGSRIVTATDSSKDGSLVAEPAYPWDSWKDEDYKRISGNDQCVNRVPYSKCSQEFLKRESCASDEKFNFVKNCPQYCEFCVPDLSG